MSAGYDYGNARLAGLRGRLVDSACLRRLGQAAGPGEFVALLGQKPDWRSIGSSPGERGRDGRAAAEDLIERWRATRQRGLLRYYEPPIRRLVEALVMPLDAERVTAILRRRRAGTRGAAASGTVAPGALLDQGTLDRLARMPTDAAFLRALGGTGLLGPEAAAALATLAEEAATSSEPEARAAATEAGLRAAVDRARAARAQGRGPDAAFLRVLLAGEAADRDAVAAELAATGPAPAALLERGLLLKRWSALGRWAYRDPLGIGPVAAYVAAVEFSVVRLRAVLARVAGAWRDPDAAPYLAGATGG
jgi:hypothetical protein